MPTELALQNLGAPGAPWTCLRYGPRQEPSLSLAGVGRFLLHMGSPVLSHLKAGTRHAALSLDEMSGNPSLSVPQEHGAAWSGDVRFLSDTL